MDGAQDIPTRLDSFIWRVLAQRSCIDQACQMINGVPGPIVELGLGNGRTYSHLAARLPGRDIWVFERWPKPNPLSMPPADRLIVGDMLETLAGAVARMGGPAVFLHMDIGNGKGDETAAFVEKLTPLVAAVMAEGGLVASDQQVRAPRLQPTALPADVREGRYFLYRAVNEHPALVL